LSFLSEIELIGSQSGEKKAVISLRNADFNGALLTETHLGEANLRAARLLGANLTKATLWGATLSEANLSGASMEGAVLWGASMGGAILDKANLKSADLRGVTDITCEQLQKALNWHLTYRDDDLACGSEIPEAPPERGVFMVEEVSN
jgi:uncharacterized protein YjbI with pentapeptide repeats